MEPRTVIRLTLNGEAREIDAPGNMPLLWVLRDLLGLSGTKYGCGIALCGACTVHVDGQPARACVLPLGSLAGRTVTTIEGLSAAGDHPLQLAWIAENVAQCGYCQAGQIMSAAALIAARPEPSDSDIDAAMAGNLCRCGTYHRIRRAIRRAAATQRAPSRGGGPA